MLCQDGVWKVRKSGWDDANFTTITTYQLQIPKMPKNNSVPGRWFKDVVCADHPWGEEDDEHKAESRHIHRHLSLAWSFSYWHVPRPPAGSTENVEPWRVGRKIVTPQGWGQVWLVGMEGREISHFLRFGGSPGTVSLSLRGCQCCDNVLYCMWAQW